MHQIRIHGRGGQGVVTAAELVAIAAFKDGKYAQAFPSFGVERTGAPIESYARISDKPIRTREQIYVPDVLIVQDASITKDVDVSKGCTKDTLVIVNSMKDINKLNINLPKENIHRVDATKIALDIIGRNIVNTVILGAFAKATELITLGGLKKAAKQKFEEKGKSLVEKNIKAIEQAYK